MKRLTRIGVLSAGLHIGAALTIFGFLCGILYAVGGLFIDLATTGLTPGTVMGFGAVLAMPVLFGVTGFFWGMLGAGVYNLTARMFGGMEMGWGE